MKLMNTLVLVMLLGFFCSCEDTYEEKPIAPVGELTSHPKDQKYSNERRVIPYKRCFNQDIDYCALNDRIEFDVYDIDPEFLNPKNYQLTLYVGSEVVSTRSFDQNCTRNNMVAFWNLLPAAYNYELTSTCSSQVYTGSFEYQGGYYATALYIDQSYCD